MKCTGRYKDVSIDFQTMKQILMLEVNDDVAGQFIELKEKEKLDIEIKPHRERRSLDANAYFHVLVGKIADKQRLSKAKVKNMLLGQYGQPMEVDDGVEAVIKTNIPINTAYEMEEPHLRYIKYEVENGFEVYFYKIIRGSHTYNSYEMSVLIDGTVSEAKDLGIDTISPVELAQLKERWNI